MYCSISCSRARRGPGSWYRRRRIFSFSSPCSDLLRPPPPVSPPPDVVDGRVEDAAQAERVAFRLVLDLVEDAGGERADERLERAVVQAHANGDVAVLGLRSVEDRVEGQLQVLQVLDRQVEADGEPA